MFFEQYGNTFHVFLCDQKYILTNLKWIQYSQTANIKILINANLL